MLLIKAVYCFSQKFQELAWDHIPRDPGDCRHLKMRITVRYDECARISQYGLNTVVSMTRTEFVRLAKEKGTR